eukprot:TRINITY_DN30826_c0_g1_i1.p1 TRINITY_DN30826_c0_g1~~TRINITY_DN30826_c0_g1_i1.p1  ORF type:complete len:191 (-),score=43.30 TRINITY_DN30826_c0_g1_i1:270-767(-)
MGDSTTPQVQKLVLRVYDKDGLYKTVAVDRTTTSLVVCVQLAKKLFRRDSSHPDPDTLRLVCVRGGAKTVMEQDDKPFFVLLDEQMKAGNIDTSKKHKPAQFFIQDENGKFAEFSTAEKEKESRIKSMLFAKKEKKVCFYLRTFVPFISQRYTGCSGRQTSVPCP